MNDIKELEQRIESLRTEMPNMTGRDRNTQRRMINELAAEIVAMRRGDVNRDELTDAEIANLSLEMRCCYFLHPWNRAMMATTVDGWANEIGFSGYGSMNTILEEEVHIANDAANKLIAFVKELIK